MSVKTGKVTAIHASANGSSATLSFPGPPPETETWMNPGDRVWDVLVAAYTKGSDVDVTYDDSTQPPTKTGAKAT
jgi:hypothetical protein